jgi:hypothetical protein
MTVQFLCPECEQTAVLRIPLAPEPWKCGKCGGGFTPQALTMAGQAGALKRCAICAGERFYTQRDFNQRIGCLIAGIGAALSPFTYGISLLACLALDAGLYFLLSQATLCYRCGAIYRGVPPNPNHGPFDLHVAEVEMQESAYLEKRK